MQTIATPGAGKLQARDFLKGLLVAAGTAILSLLIPVLDSGHLPATWVEWKPILIAGVAAAATYLAKNFFTGGKIVIINPPSEVVEKVNKGEATATIVSSK